MRSIKRLQIVYFLLLALNWFSIALPLALVVLLHQARGLDLFQIGVLMGAYSLTIVLLEVPTGGLADAIGRRQVALLANAFSLASGLIFIFAFSFPLFLLTWVLSGIGRALGSGSLDAWFVDELQRLDPEIDLQPPLAKAGTVSLLALGAGTFLGGLIPHLSNNLPIDGTAVLTPLVLPIIAATGIKILLLILILTLVVESNRQAIPDQWRSGIREVPFIVRDAFSLSRQNRTIMLLLVLAAVAGLSLTTVETFWQPRFADLIGGSGGKTIFFGATMAGSFLFGAVGNLGSIPVSNLLKKRYSLLAGLIQAGQALALILLANQNLVVPAMAFFWLFYLTIGMSNSPMATLMNLQIPSERRSAMLSIQSLASYLGMILGSVGLGYIAKNGSIVQAWLVAGGVLLVSLPLYNRLENRRDFREQPYELETPFSESTQEANPG